MSANGCEQLPPSQFIQLRGSARSDGAIGKAILADRPGDYMRHSSDTALGLRCIPSQGSEDMTSGQLRMIRISSS